MEKPINKLGRDYCWGCKKVSLHTNQYSNDKLKMKSTCLLCEHVSFWHVSVYPHFKEADSSKQIDYVVKDIEEHLNRI